MSPVLLRKLCYCILVIGTAYLASLLYFDLLKLRSIEILDTFKQAAILDAVKFVETENQEPNSLELRTHNPNSPKRWDLNQTSIIFLKTHKTASSTIQNLMYRLADTRHKQICFSSGEKNNIHWPNKFNYENFKNGYKGEFISKTLVNNGVYQSEHDKNYLKFDIFCNHARYSQDMELVMKYPKNIFKFTILRDPFTLLRSSYSYLRGWVLCPFGRYFFRHVNRKEKCVYIFRFKFEIVGLKVDSPEQKSKLLGDFFIKLLIFDSVFFASHR